MENSYKIRISGMDLPIELPLSRPKPKGRLDALADRLGFKIIPTYRRRGSNQTHARGALKAIIAEHGEGHLVTVVRCIRETGGNRQELWSETLLAISDVLAMRPDWRDAGGDLLDAFDAIPLVSLREAVVRCRPWPVRHTAARDDLCAPGGGSGGQGGGIGDPCQLSPMEDVSANGAHPTITISVTVVRLRRKVRLAPRRGKSALPSRATVQGDILSPCHSKSS
ncbi:hypothetical protein [Fulvimarina sp. MAC3]|uniref:hypothetical protein n=1 Tax=Fulvimarina sp. MAC3 TaxID=3148887 RepID=UPI0031FE3A55